MPVTEPLLNSARFFATILLELIPLFFVITFLSGLALEYVSPEMLREKLAGRKGVIGRLAGVFFGFVTPFCSCSTIPMLAGMVRAGIPIGVMTTFLFASPYPVEMVVPILAPLFGIPIALAFVAAGVVVPFVTGTVVERLGWQNQVKPDLAGAPSLEEPGGTDLLVVIKDRFTDKARRAWLYTLGFAKKLLLTIVISSAVGALIYGLIPQQVILKYAGGDSLLAVPVAALIGAPLYVNVAAVVPIVYSLSLKGMSHGAVLAFLITATSVSPPEILMLAAMFKKSYVATFVAATIIGAILTGCILNLVP